MFEKLESTKEHYYDLEKQLASPDLLADMDKWQQVNREYVGLKDLVKAYEEYRENEDRISENKEMLEATEDQEFLDLLHEEIHESEKY